jgi:hypothetical protein
VALTPVFLLPVAAGFIAVRAANPHLVEQTYWRWWQPRTVLPWAVFAPEVPTAVPATALVLIAVGAVSFVVGRMGGPVPRRAWGHSALWAVAGLAMSIAPAAFWYERPIWLPQALVAEWVPIYQLVRAPIRLGVDFLIGIALLTGLAFTECARRLAGVGRVAPAALAALFTVVTYARFAHGEPSFIRTPLPASYPLQTAISADSPLIELLRRPGGPLLELPVALDPVMGCVPRPHARAEYRSIFHWRPLLNGYNGYWPAGFIERMRVAERLPDPAALQALREDPGLELILVHMDDLPPAGRAVWYELAERGREDLRLAGRDGDDLLFAVSVPGE